MKQIGIQNIDTYVFPSIFSSEKRVFLVFSLKMGKFDLGKICKRIFFVWMSWWIFKVTRIELEFSLDQNNDWFKSGKRKCKKQKI